MEVIEWFSWLFSGFLFCSHDDNICVRERLLFGCWIYLVVVLVQSLQFAAPYGKFLKQSANDIPDPFLGFRISAGLAWMLQEIPAAVFGLIGMYESYNNKDLNSLKLLVPFTLHYLNRSVIFPLRLKTGKPVPFFTVIMAFQFCLFNGLLQNLYLRDRQSFLSLQCNLLEYLGLGIFVCGMFINIQSDSILTNLRKPGETGYKIPVGGIFKFVSAPNYFGESMEWWGWFLFNPNPASFWFASFTTIFLGTRAFKTHQFYKTKFEDYPRERKAFIPYVL